MIRNIIERSALLIALGKTYPNGVKVDRLDEVMKTWRSHCKFLKDRGVNIKIYDDVVVLKSPLYYDLYQSVPPEIRRSIEDILWKIIPKETIIDESVVAQMTIQVLDEVLNAFISKLPPSVKQIDADGTKWIIREGERFPIACIHCSDPSCMTYDIKAFGTTDAFSSRVCPANAIIQTQEGIVEINKSMCTGCMLCIVRCPVNTISLIEGIATKRGYDQLPDKDKYIKQVTVLIEEKREICADTLEKLGKVSTPLKVDGDIRQILDNFDDNMSITKFNWDQDKYYVFVRNCFRELGLEAIYSGASGKLRRSDVTIKAPFFAGVEVKSPAEGDITVGAIRQAVDAALEVSHTYQAPSPYSAVVGHEIGRGAHRRSVRWYNFKQIKVPLIRSRYLLYLMLKHKTDLPQDPKRDIERLFNDFYGWFGKEELTEYFKVYFQSRKDELSTRKISLVMPPEVNELLRAGETNNALRTLEQLENATYRQIRRCFPDPHRKARGLYAVR